MRGDLITLVKTGAFIRRNGATYEVIVADDKTFVIAPTFGGTTDYKDLEAYSNLPNINTLSDLNFEEVTK